MKSLDFTTGLVEFFLQLVMNGMFLLPAVFLCFYAIGEENLRVEARRVAVVAILSVAAYTVIYFPLWYYFGFPDSFFMIFYIVAGFLYYRHAAKPEGAKLFFVYLAVLFVLMFSNTAFNLIRRILLHYDSSDLWVWQEVVLMAVLTVIVTPLAAWFMKKRVWPAVAGLPVGGWKYLWVLPTVFVALMTALNYFLVEGLVELGWQAMTLITALAAVAFVSLMQALHMVETHRENARQKEILRMMGEQSSRYAEMAAHTEEMKLLRHDIRHHMNVIDGMLREKHYAQAEQYLRDYRPKIELAEQPLCDCYVVDIIARRYRAQAREAGIGIDFKLALPASPGVEDMDLCVALGNLLENALHACAAQKRGERFIRALAKTDGNEILICVENSCDVQHENHGEGLGIPSVHAIADKYTGIAGFERNGNVFSASVLLYGKTT